MYASATETAPRATRRAWFGLAILALPTLLLSLDVSVLYLALPQLSGDLGASSTEQLWILDIYSFLLAGFLVTMGTLGDRIGRRRLLLIGGAAFGLASLLAAYSTSAEMLIASRALLGVAGATLAPSTMALIRNMFPDPKQMGQAIAIWFACFMSGMTIGPLVGGALLEHFWWGSAFLLGIPVMVLLLVLGPILLPEYKDANAGRLDLASVAMSLAAILPVIYGLKSIARDGVHTTAVAVTVVGLAFGVAFVRRQRTLEHPLLDLRLFTNGRFSTALSTMWFGGLVMAGVSLVSAMYLQLVEGFSPLTAGLWLIPQNLAMIAGFQVAPRLAQRFRVSRVVASGLAISAVGFLMMTRVPAEDGLGWLIGGLVLAAAGMSLPMALTANIIMGATPPEKAGSAAAVMETSGEFGIAVGIATLGSLATFVYRGQVGDGLPSGLPNSLATAMNDSLAVALNATSRTDLLDVARSAFTSGLNVVSGVGAAIFLTLAAICLAVLRRADQPAPVEAATDDSVPVATATDDRVPVAAAADH
jgi:MFS transporter, DHA2 family, multidrug resistance protein